MSKGCEIKKRSPKSHRTWYLHTTFPSTDAALQYIREERVWSIKVTNETWDGLKVYYRCNQVKKSQRQCRAELYLHYLPNSDHVNCYKTPFEHDHGACRTITFTLEKKAAINQLFDKGLSYCQIFEELERIGFRLDNPIQLKNYLTRHKKKRHHKSFIAVTELFIWCRDHLQTPDDPTLPFVLSCVKPGIGSSECPDFRVVISTGVLLQQLDHCELIYAEMSTKWTHFDLPIVIIGNLDADKGFTPVVIAVGSGHDGSSSGGDLNALFKLLKQTVPSNRIRHLISPNEDIRTTFNAIFGDSMEMPYLNLMESLRKSFNKVIVDIMADTMDEFATRCQCERSVEQAGPPSKQFQDKCKLRELQFMAELQSRWISVNADMTGQTESLRNINAHTMFSGWVESQRMFTEKMSTFDFLEELFTSLKKVSEACVLTTKRMEVRLV